MSDTPTPAQLFSVVPATQTAPAQLFRNALRHCPPDTQGILIAFYGSDGRIGFMSHGMPQDVLWLAQTVAVTLPLGISPDEDDDDQPPPPDDGGEPVAA